jgi:hypothetical protein
MCNFFPPSAGLSTFHMLKESPPAHRLLSSDMAQQDHSGRGWGLDTRFSWGRGRGNTWSQGEPGRSHQGDRGGRAGRAGRGGRGGGGNNICRNFRTGYCSFGGGCRFSHDLTSSTEHGPSSPVRGHIEITPEREQARTDYNSWKRLLKVPPTRNNTAISETIFKIIFLSELMLYSKNVSP